jgi:hypothetical protein
MTRRPTVARLRPAAGLGGRRLLSSGNVVHTVWVSSWTDPTDEEGSGSRPAEDQHRRPRLLTPRTSSCATSYPAWLALIRALALFGRIRLTPADAASFAGEFLGDPEHVA